jgi:hypothetical protein
MKYNFIILIFFFACGLAFSQVPEHLWAQNITGSDLSYGKSTAVDASGNTYVTGYFNSFSITLGSVFYNSGGNDIFIAKYNSSGSLIWAKTAGGSGDDKSLELSLDGAGNPYITGYFNSPSIKFSLTLSLSNAGSEDIFIAKYSASTGSPVWAKRIAGAGQEEGTGIMNDASGNVYVTGFFDSPSVTAGTATFTNADMMSDFFIAKYNSSGVFQWMKSSAGTGADKGTGVSGDLAGNIYVSGNFSSSNFTLDTFTLSSNGADDIFLAKYDASGNVLWAKSAGGGQSDNVSKIAVRADGKIYLTGYFISDSLYFGTDLLINSGTGTEDIFLTKYDPLGNPVWAKSIGGQENERSVDVCLDTAGHVYITGNYVDSSIVFDSISLLNANQGTTDIFTAEFDASGTVLWAKTIGGTSDDAVESIAIEVSGNYVLTGGYLSDIFTFGSLSLTNKGDYNYWLVKYNPGGGYPLLLKSLESAHFNCGRAISVDKYGNSYVTGFFDTPTITIGSFQLNNKGKKNIFIAKIDPSGNVIWAKAAGGTDTDIPSGVVADSSGNCYVTGGYNSNPITFDALTLSGYSTSDFFLVKYDPAGNAVWARRGTANGNASGHQMVADGNGNIFIVGSYTSSIFAGMNTLYASGSSLEIFIVKYDSSGNIVWTRSPGGDDWDEADGVAIDQSENIYISGRYHSTSLNLGSGVYIAGSGPSGPACFFLAKYDSLGIPQWIRGGYPAAEWSGVTSDAFGNSYSFSSTNDPTNDTLWKYDSNGLVIWKKIIPLRAVPVTIKVNANNNFYLAGEFDGGSCTFGSYTLMNSLSASDIFIAAYNSAGDPQWAKQAGGPGQDDVTGLGVDDLNNIYYTGFYESETCMFDTIGIMNSGGTDVYVAKIDSIGFLPTDAASGLTIEKTPGWKVYPNPGTGKYCLVPVYNKAGITDITIDVYNTFGENVFQKRCHEYQDLLIDISGLSDGIYFIELCTNGTISRQKIIMSR